MGLEQNPPEIEEEKEFYTIEEVEKIIRRNRATIYNRMKLIDVKTHKFPYDRKTYIAAKDVEKIKAVFDKPWIATKREEGAEEEVASPRCTVCPFATSDPLHSHEPLLAL